MVTVTLTPTASRTSLNILWETTSEGLHLKHLKSVSRTGPQPPKVRTATFLRLSYLTSFLLLSLGASCFAQAITIRVINAADGPLRKQQVSVSPRRAGREDSCELRIDFEQRNGR